MKKYFLLSTILISTMAFGQGSLDDEAPIVASTPAGGNATGTLGNLTVTGVHDDTVADCSADGQGWRKSGGSYVCNSLVDENTTFTGCTSGSIASGVNIECIDNVSYELNSGTVVDGHVPRHNGTSFINAPLAASDITYDGNTLDRTADAVNLQTNCPTSTPRNITKLVETVRVDTSSANVNVNLSLCTDTRQHVKITNCNGTDTFAKIALISGSDTIRRSNNVVETVGVSSNISSRDIDLKCNGAGEWKSKLI